jgi:hypothetical protein
MSGIVEREAAGSVDWHCTSIRCRAHFLPCVNLKGFVVVLEEGGGG